jgi:branched-chain amino acid transport system ATP-binding protein
MNRGKMMLLDEPSMGLAPILVKDLFENLSKINEEGTTILLVEQNAHLALRYATKAYVLETGTITLSGTSEEVEKNPEVKKAYLGT